MLFARHVLEISTDQDLYYVYPTSQDRLLHQSESETVVRGYVTAILPRATSILSLGVQLRTQFSLAANSSNRKGTKKGTLQSQKICLPIGDRVYSSGRHQFFFSFILSSTTASSERRRKSCVETVISASLSMAPSQKSLEAEKRIKCVANPGGPNELPPGIEMFLHETSSNLGPYSVELVADSLTVASLLNLRIHFDRPPQTSRMDRIVGEVLQTTTYKDPTAQTVQRTTMFDHSGPSISTHPPDSANKSSICIALTSRLPSDDQLRPSTSPHTNTVIRTSHELLITVHYYMKLDLSSRQRRCEITIRKPVQIASCCCMLETLLLPAYSAKEQVTEACGPSCVCEYSLAALMEGSTLAKTWSLPSGDVIGDRSRKKCT